MTSSHSFSRRSFLKSAVVAGAAPLILPAGVWSAETMPSSKIALGFVGLGTQGVGLMRGFLPRTDATVLAVSDVDTTRRKNAKRIVEIRYEAEMTAGSYKGCAEYNDFQELLARKDIDGVVIATPDHWHALISIAAAQAGKDVYCEKPMSHTIHEGRAMVNAVRANKRILQVGSMQRSMTEFRVTCELIRNGILGTVMKVDVAVGGPGRPCDLPAETDEPGLDWNRWLGPAPMRPYNPVLSPRGVHKDFPQWRQYLEYGGGDVCDWGAHHFDIVQWAFGFDDSGPVEIIAAAQPNAREGARVRYATGLEVTHCAGNDITFYGDKGKILVNRGKFKLWLGDQLKAEDVHECRSVVQELLPANAVRLYLSENQLSDWLSSMRSRKLPICDVETGHRTATICNLVNLTYYHHQSLKWDPKTEQFVGGTGDAKWLTYDYRQPWKVG